MSNHIILWSTLLLPWLTIFFMKKEEIKRFMPAALFTIIISLLIFDIGITLKMWVVKDNIYPLNEIVPLEFGLLPVTTLWFLKFFYRRFWLYCIVQLVFSIGFAYILQPWLSTRGIWVRVNATSFLALLPAIPHFISIYLYQMWQEDIRGSITYKN